MDKKMENEIEIAPVSPYDEGAPKINAAPVFGASPGKEFFYAVPACGERPLRFAVRGKMPSGVTFDPVKGWFQGRAVESGEFRVILYAENALGKDEKEFRIVIGENRICLTPLLGWTSWNAYTKNVSDELIRKNAAALVGKGLAARGYSYVNIDSCWQGQRDPETNAIQGNQHFPDMKGLVEYIHGLGLKAGIYSTPMVHAWGSTPDRLLPGSTGYPLDPAYFHGYFGGCGQTGFEDSDARQWAEWKFDYLKYDWPSCDEEHTRKMSEALRKTDRDFVLSLTTRCELGWIETYKQFANMYRSNADTVDSWDRLSANAFQADQWAPHISPGNWFDMDMLALGHMTIGTTSSNFQERALRENRLARNEMITHMSMWALFPSPIQLSCDLGMIDDFTLSLLSNEEILAMNQDELGNGAVCVREDIRKDENGSILRHVKVYLRRLSGNREALGFFNPGEGTERVSYSGFGTRSVRDLWARKELGLFENTLSFDVPPHGCRIVVLS